MRLRSRSSPRSISRLASSPTTRKKNVIRPWFTQWRRSIAMWALPRLIESFVPQTESYESGHGELAQTSAAMVAPSSTAALPVSVARKSRTGAARLRAQAVLPVNGVVAVASAISSPRYLPRQGARKGACPYPPSAMTAGTVAPGARDDTASFDLARFEWTAPDRLEVAGHWLGVRGLRFMRPTLEVYTADGERHRLLALLDHKPWEAEAGREWVAAFPWKGERPQLAS